MMMMMNGRFSLGDKRRQAGADVGDRGSPLKCISIIIIIVSISIIIHILFITLTCKP